MADSALAYSYEYLVHVCGDLRHFYLGGIAVVEREDDGTLTIGGTAPCGLSSAGFHEWPDALLDWRRTIHYVLLDMASGCETVCDFDDAVKEWVQIACPDHLRSEYEEAERKLISIDRHGVIPEWAERLGDSWYQIKDLVGPGDF